jgi:hypothetical protein
VVWIIRTCFPIRAAASQGFCPPGSCMNVSTYPQWKEPDVNIRRVLFAIAGVGILAGVVPFASGVASAATPPAVARFSAGVTSNQSATLASTLASNASGARIGPNQVDWNNGTMLSAQASTAQAVTPGMAAVVASASGPPNNSAAVPRPGIIWYFIGHIYPYTTAGYHACDLQGEVYLVAGFQGFSCRPNDPIANHWNLWVALLV